MGPVQTLLPMNSMIPRGQPCAVLNIKDCFFSIPLHEEDKERFTFSIVFPNSQQPNLCFQWKMLPQGMFNSPTICQINSGLSASTSPAEQSNCDHHAVHGRRPDHRTINKPSRLASVNYLQDLKDKWLRNSECKNKKGTVHNLPRSGNLKLLHNPSPDKNSLRHQNAP